MLLNIFNIFLWRGKRNSILKYAFNRLNVRKDMLNFLKRAFESAQFRGKQSL